MYYMSRIIFAACIFHARRVMILGRCNSSSVARCISELSKKQLSAGAQGYRKKFYLSRIVECDMKK